VYSLSMVLDDPPAPAARDELGLETCDAPARRLCRIDVYQGKRSGEEKGEHEGGSFSRKGTHRICAPGGFATAPAADVEREETEREGASESD